MKRLFINLDLTGCVWNRIQPKEIKINMTSIPTQRSVDCLLLVNFNGVKNRILSNINTQFLNTTQGNDNAIINITLDEKILLILFHILHYLNSYNQTYCINVSNCHNTLLQMVLWCQILHQADFDKAVEGKNDTLMSVSILLLIFAKLNWYCCFKPFRYL